MTDDIKVKREKEQRRSSFTPSVLGEKTKPAFWLFLCMRTAFKDPENKT